MFANLQESASVCSKCVRRLGQADTVRLWDGKEYCRECVSHASSELLKVADNSDVLSERISVDPYVAVRDSWFLTLIVGLLFAGLLGFVGSQQMGVRGLLFGTFLGASVSIVSGTLRAIGVRSNARSVGGEIMVTKGHFTAWHPIIGRTTCNLCECRWHIGKSHEASSFLPKLYLRRKLIVVDCQSKLQILGMRRERVPCGFTDEKREVWQAFFQLAGVEYKPRRWWLRWL